MEGVTNGEFEQLDTVSGRSVWSVVVSLNERPVAVLPVEILRNMCLCCGKWCQTRDRTEYNYTVL